MNKKEFVETWQIHNNINLYLLNSINEENLTDVLSSKGRNVGEQFAHIHNVRLLWLQSARPELFKDQKKIDKESKITKKTLVDELIKSAKAITSLLETGFETGRIEGFKPHAGAFLGYLISHESHHRGQIILCLKQSGHPVDKKTAFGIWEWGTKLS